MGITGLSNFQEGGQMDQQEHRGDAPDVPQDEMTAEELARQGKQPDDAQAAEADQVQRGHEASDEAAEPPEQNDDEASDGDDNGDDNDDEPAPVDDPDLPEDGDPEADDLEPEPLGPPTGDPEDSGETREEPADLSGVQKEFED